MFEVEVKRRSTRPLSDVEDALRRTGGVFVGEWVEVDYYYNHPCRDFSESDEALRVRVSNGEARITYKGPKVGSRGKVRVEIDLPVGSSEDAVSLLESLGFVRVAMVRKKRRVYRVGKAVVSLDKVEGLGEFVEVEVKVDSRKDLRRALEFCESILASLGVRGRNIRRSYLELQLKREASKRARSTSTRPSST